MKKVKAKVVKKYDTGGVLTADELNAAAKGDSTQSQVSSNQFSSLAGSMGPIGQGFGVLTGLISSVVGSSLANKANTQANNLTTAQLYSQKAAAKEEEDKSRNFGYPYQGTGNVNYYAATGGKLLKYSAGGINPAIATTTTGGKLVPQSSDAAVADGNTHAEGGIVMKKEGQPIAEIEDGEVVDADGKVYSNRINLPNGKTVAEDTLKYIQAKGKAEQKKTPYDQYINGTADRNIEKANIHMAQNFAFQEALKLAMGIHPTQQIKQSNTQGVQRDQQTDENTQDNQNDESQESNDQGSPVPTQKNGGLIRLHKGRDKLMGVTQPDNDGSTFAKGGKIKKYADGGDGLVLNDDNDLHYDWNLDDDSKPYNPPNYKTGDNYVSPNVAITIPTTTPTTSNNTWLSTITGLGKGLLPLVDNVANGIIQKKTPATPYPTMNKASYMKTSLNLNPELNNIDQGVANASNDINRNNSNTATANVNRMAIHTAGIGMKNQILQGKDAAETSLINQQAMNTQNVNASNNAKVDNYNNQNFNRTMYLNQQTSKNVANGANDLMQMIKDSDTQGLDMSKAKMAVLQSKDTGTFVNLMGNDSFDKLIKSDPNFGKQLGDSLNGDAKTKWYQYYGLN